MITELQTNKSNLYEQDYYQWLTITLEKLQAQDYQEIDWENLIEEIAYLSRKERHKLASLLTRLWEHLLKLKYWHSERAYNAAHWRGEITNFRVQIQRIIKDSPSLKPFIQEIFSECYQDACKIVSQRSQILRDHFPLQPIASLEQILDENWFPDY